MNVMQQTTCLVVYRVNPITVNNFVALFNCTPAGRTSDLMMALAKFFKYLSWLRLDALSLVGPTVVQLFGFCCLVLVLLLRTHLGQSQCWILMCKFAVLMHWWVEVLHADRTTFIYVYELQQNLRRWFLERETGLSPPPPVIYYWPFQGGASVVVYSYCNCVSASCRYLTTCWVCLG